MLRVQWCSRLILSVLCFFHSFFFAGGECWYNDELHTEGLEVITPEPCLNCTCSRGALLCYLRVCPTLPDPPPPGCILLHRFHTCCQELICADNNRNLVEARSSIDDSDILEEEKTLDKVCTVNGSIYAPGSAMDSSSLCEYCYCLGGKQVCVKPKCLLPLDNCVPMYDSTNCCPVHYDCNNTKRTTTTTMKTKEVNKNTGCTVDDIYYKEGTKVLGAGHTECDNCYCLGGVVRCEPLACAPPLFGCSPIIRPGECCAISYNCSGVIEIKAEPNYGDFPTISKDYAKLHKEQRFSDKTSNNYLTYELPQTTKTQRNTDSVVGHIIERPFFDAKTAIPFLQNAIKTTTNKDAHKSNVVEPALKVHTLGNLILESKVSIFDNKRSDNWELEDRLYRKIDAESNTTLPDEETTTGSIQTTEFSSTTEEITETIGTSTLWSSEEPTDAPSETPPDIVTLILNSTDCIDTFVEVTTVQSREYEDNTNSEQTKTTETPLTVENAIQSTNINISEKSNVLPNITNTNSDYEYDYNEASLPPSLPNLRIIPFVAADALDLENTEQTVYADNEHENDASVINYNLFSPPIETEGGFVPKAPPLLENFYENGISSTTGLPKIDKINCIVKQHEVAHGLSVESASSCETCVCYYGNVVCEKIKCPIPILDCQKSVDQDVNACCPRYVCDNEVPGPIQRMDVALTLQESSGHTQNSSRILVDKTRTTQKPDPLTTAVDFLFTESNEHVINTSNNPNDNGFSVDQVLNFLFPNRVLNQTSTKKSTLSDFSTTPRSDFENEDEDQIKDDVELSSSLAILKLAGCNIYGRMYRVGRIISELSNPCLECKCTEIGVQCKALNC